MKVLVACEESQTVCKAFRALGHEAYSCDIQDCSGGHPEWHIKGDVLKIINDGWDLMIAHPPCTYLSYAATGVWNKEGRAELRQEAHDFFMELYNAPVPKIAVENPQGWMNTVFRKPDQIIQPYYFGDPHKKRTCLWLKNLQPLYYDKTKVVEPEPLGYYKTGKKIGKPIYFSDGMKGGKDQAKNRSKTFQGIAQAFATQWGGVV